MGFKTVGSYVTPLRTLKPELDGSKRVVDHKEPVYLQELSLTESPRDQQLRTALMFGGFFRPNKQDTSNLLFNGY